VVLQPAARDLHAEVADLARDRRPRVVIVVPWGERLGGGEVMLWSFLRRITPARLDPDVVFLQAGSFERDVAALGLRTHVVPATRLRRVGESGRAIRRLSVLLRELEPDLVLSWAAKPHLYAAPAAMLAHRGTPLAWWQHGIPERHWLDRIATRLPAVAIGCSSHAAAKAQGRMTPSRSLFVVHPGVEPAPPDRRSRRAVRHALGLPEEGFLAGVVGRLQPDKGQDRFLCALALLRARGRDLHGVVVGGDAFGLSPEYAASIPALIGDLGLESSVTLTGQVPQVAPYLRALDVLVNPSQGESFGIAIVEAMAAGVPVVNTAKGGPEEVIEPGVEGIVLESREPEAIAAAIEALMVDDGRRARMGRAARERAARFTADAMARRLEDMVLELAR
jgi:glycosyltransferase involved in cell wall biosynthesis